MSDAVIVQLGDFPFPVVQQPHSRVKHGLRRIVKGLPDIGLDLSDLAGLLADPEGLGAVVDRVLDVADTAIYEALCILIPGVKKAMPLHVFLGYATAEAHANDDYDPDLATDPTGPQIVAALRAGMTVNGLGDMGKALTQAPRLPSGI